MDPESIGTKPQSYSFQSPDYNSQTKTFAQIVISPQIADKGTNKPDKAEESQLLPQNDNESKLEEILDIS